MPVTSSSHQDYRTVTEPTDVITNPGFYGFIMMIFKIDVPEVTANDLTHIVFYYLKDLLFIIYASFHLKPKLGNVFLM